MRFSLFSALILVLLFSVAIALISPILRPKPQYEAIFGGGSNSWVKAEVRNSSLFRGSDIPTIVIGDSQSKFVPWLDGRNLPYAIIVHHPNSEKIDFRSTLTSETLKFTVINELKIADATITFTYSLIPNDDPTQITEKMELDGDNIDPSNGRVIELTMSNGQYTERQITPKILNRTILPNQPSNTREQMMPVIEWWRQTQRDANDE